MPYEFTGTNLVRVYITDGDGAIFKPSQFISAQVQHYVGTPISGAEPVDPFVIILTKNGYSVVNGIYQGTIQIGYLQGLTSAEASALLSDVYSAIDEYQQTLV
jgi:hypothetical protein